MILQKLNSLILCSITFCLTLIPFNYIIGSKFAWFSYATVALPVFGCQQSLLYVILYFLTKSLFIKSIGILFFIKRLPTVMATLALQDWNIYIAVWYPLCAIVLFSLHPVGSHVFYYSWYWFIPVLLYLFGSDTIYSRALIASFVAHATGSVIWLYIGGIDVTVWQALVPLVIVERLFIAGGMVYLTMLYTSVQRYILRKVYA